MNKRSVATTLRMSGKSIGFIAECVGISKSTASLWLRDVPLSHMQKEKLVENRNKELAKGRKIALVNNKNKVDLIQKQSSIFAQTKVGNISERDVFMLCLGLYWAEGSKTENKFIFVNSDPAMIILLIQYLRKHYQVKKEDIVFRIYINNVYKEEYLHILKYWALAINVSKDLFHKPIFMHYKQKRQYLNKKDYKGILHLQVKKSSALLYKHLSMINQVKLALKSA